MQSAESTDSSPPEDELGVVDRIVAATGGSPDCTIEILRQIQDHFHYLPEAALRRVCAVSEIRPADVDGVASFYSQFRREPVGRHRIRVCIGTACHVKGAENVFKAFQRALNIGEDEDTDPDRLFTVERVACLGCCMLAPAVQIDDTTYGFVEPARVGDVLADFLASQALGAGADDRQLPPGVAVGEIRLCLCSSCVAAGTAVLKRDFESASAALGLSVVLKTVGCTGQSFHAPMVEVAQTHGPSFRYAGVTADQVVAILRRHFRPPRLVQRLQDAGRRLLEALVTDDAWGPVTRYAIDTREDFCNPESASPLIVMEGAGSCDPVDLADYRRHGGLAALETCFTAMTPATVLDVLKASGLRGRGGAGYPTGQKWQMVHDATATPKYVICNGDEGDPGAFMDRMVLESFPFRVLEGILIAAHTVGAVEAILYVRHEYPLAVERLRQAIERFETAGLIGPNILGSGVGVRVRIVVGAGAFVCGEETALIAAIEGGRGMPRYRPPYPAESGLWGAPTLVNNVETLASVPWILRHGPAAYAELGTASSKGTKTFALAGKVQRGGLVEVPMGMTLRAIINDIGGGVPEGHQLKAVQIGGPSGGCVPASLADTPVDYAALTTVGAIMGSGGLVVLDETDCMVAIARYFLKFTQVESCGRCTFCRIGTRRMLEILDRLCAGQGANADLDELEHLATRVRDGSLCGLGRTAPNPVLSTLRYFRDEFEAHVNGRCPAGKCESLIHYTIGKACIGCTRCAQACPAGAIIPTPYRQHIIIDDRCTRCDSCRQVCPVGAVTVETGD